MILKRSLHQYQMGYSKVVLQKQLRKRYSLFLLAVSDYKQWDTSFCYTISWRRLGPFRHWKQLRPWEVCSLDGPWSFVASNSLMHSIHRCTVLEVIAVLQYNNHDGVIHARVLKACISSKYSKCISAIKRILYTTAMHISSSSFVYLCFFLFTAMDVKNLAFCVWEWRRFTYNSSFDDLHWSISLARTWKIWITSKILVQLLGGDSPRFLPWLRTRLTPHCFLPKRVAYLSLRVWKPLRTHSTCFLSSDNVFSGLFVWPLPQFRNWRCWVRAITSLNVY